MFELQMNWWELVVRAAVIYAALLVFVRMSGRRTVGQFTPFDLLVVMLLSEAVSNGLTGSEESVTGGLLAAFTLVALNLLVAFVTSHSIRAQNIVEGQAVLISRNGEVYRNMLKKHRLPDSDLDQALREADCDLQEMRFAFLEADGKISVLKESSGRVAST